MLNPLQSTIVRVIFYVLSPLSSLAARPVFGRGCREPRGWDDHHRHRSYGGIGRGRHGNLGRRFRQVGKALSHKERRYTTFYGAVGRGWRPTTAPLLGPAFPGNHHACLWVLSL